MASPHPHPTGLLVTCPVDLCCPSAGFTAVERLRAMGCTVTVPAQGCCGRTLLERGDRRGATGMAHGMIGAFAGCGPVAVPNRACAAMVRDQYPVLLADDAAWGGRARDLAARCRDLTDLLIRAGDPRTDALSRQVIATRDRTLAHLDRHLRMVEDRLRDSGGQVHWATSAGDAVAIIRQLCLNHGIGPAILDGSPLLMEIGLEEALAGAGMTGSGAASPPLIGISGAGFLVAETGSAVIIPDAGPDAGLDSGAADTLFAPCHIVVAAIDRVVPTLSDASALLRLWSEGGGLPPRVLFATGPRGAGDADGPDIFHLVLLDNGRTDLLAASGAPPPRLAQRAGWVWRLLSRHPSLYRRVTSFVSRVHGYGGSFQARWRDAGHG